MTETSHRLPGFPEVSDPLRFWSRHRPGRTALVVRARGERTSYRELDRAADRWARWLAAADVGPGDRVATLAANREEMIHLYFACGRLGAVLVPLNWRLAEPELRHVLEDARPDLVLGEERFREAARSALEGGRWMDIDAVEPPDAGSGEPRGARAGAGEPPRRARPDEPRLLLYTSGTTGRPKGAVIPRRQVFHNAVATTTAWELGPDDVAPITTPLFHTGGWHVLATPLWHRGGRVVLLDGFDPGTFLAVMAEERCTTALTVPTQLRMLREAADWGRELPALRTFFAGGEPLPASLAEDVRDAGYAVRQGYGLTECGPNCFAITDEEARRKPESVGRPAPFLEARLVTEEGDEPDAGEPGELQLRGPQMFGGYFRDPEGTAEAFTEDGWLRTGDLARRDADGDYRICGRRTEMFISGGENVFPAEVEAVLDEHPDVSEAAVVGAPHDRWGQVGHAFVVPAGGRDDTESHRREDALEEEIRAFASSRLARYKVPKRFTFLDELPKLGSGKPDRSALSERARRAAGP